jgi:hypothetical protein
VELDGPVETGQVGEVASIPTVDPEGVGTAVGASRSLRGDRQVDGQIVEVKRAIDHATLDGNREEFEWKQQRSPWMQFDRC